MLQHWRKRPVFFRGSTSAISVIVVLLVAGLALKGCGNQTGEQRSTEREQAVVIALKADFDSLLFLNTATSDALHVIEEMLFLTLCEMDAQLELQPRLAERWEFNDDGREITFWLRRDVRWTDGRLTTAHDVLFTYQLATHPDAGFADRQRFDQIDSVIVVDDYTIRFKFKTAYPEALLDVQFPVLPQHLLAGMAPAEIKSCAFNRTPVGNGPYKLVEWQTNDKIVFAANNEYYAGPPHLQQVIFRVIPDETVMLANLRTGEVDVVPSVPHREAAALAQQPELRVQRYPERGYWFLGLNLERPVFKNRQVRQALSRAIDRQQLIAALLYGNGREVAGPIMPYFPVYDDSLNGSGFDSAAARQLLSTAGWRDQNHDGVREKQGKSLAFTIKTNSNSRLRSEAAVIIQEELRQVGVQAAPQLMEWGALVDEVLKRKDFDAVLLSWKTGYKIDPSMLWHSDAIANGYNLCSYRNAEVDSLLTAARSETDPQRSRRLWQRFQRRIVEDAPYVFLFSQDYAAAVRSTLQNVKIDVRGYLVNIEQWRYEEPATSKNNGGDDSMRQVAGRAEPTRDGSME